jgi:hypothetical protein
MEATIFRLLYQFTWLSDEEHENCTMQDMYVLFYKETVRTFFQSDCAKLHLHQQ